MVSPGLNLSNYETLCPETLSKRAEDFEKPKSGFGISCTTNPGSVICASTYSLRTPPQPPHNPPNPHPPPTPDPPTFPAASLIDQRASLSGSGVKFLTTSQCRPAVRQSHCYPSFHSASTSITPFAYKKQAPMQLHENSGLGTRTKSRMVFFLSGLAGDGRRTADEHCRCGMPCQPSRSGFADFACGMRGHSTPCRLNVSESCPSATLSASVWRVPGVAGWELYTNRSLCRTS